MDNAQLLKDKIKTVQNEAIIEMLNALDKKQLISMMSGIIDLFSLQEQVIEVFKTIANE